MRILDVKNSLLELRPNNVVSDSSIIKWCSRVDQRIYDKVYSIYGAIEISLSQNVQMYALPEGVLFDRIKKVYVNGILYSKIDVTAYNKVGYWLADGKLNIYPIPVNDSYIMRIIYQVAKGDYASLDNELLVPEPYCDELYPFFCASKLDLLNRNYDDYNNMTALYNSAYEEYSKFYKSSAPSPNITIRNYW